MTRLALVLAVVAVTAAFASAADSPEAVANPSPAVRTPAVIDPALAQRLQTAQPDELIEVIVVLRDQASIASQAKARRAARLHAVVAALHAKADVAQKGIRAFLKRAQAAGDVRQVEPLWIFNGIIASARPAVIRQLAARPEVQAIQLSASIDAPPPVAASAAPESNISLVNAPALWGRGYRGQGVVVANMDTGVDATHPDLAGSWRGGTNSWYDPNGEHRTTPTDISGHGTWTMGVMVGGAAGGSAIGVAPGAKWIGVKIFNDRGYATLAGIHKGLQWLLDPDGNPNTADAPNVVNGSWTLSATGCNLFAQLDLRNLRNAGILPVFAAGNRGPGSSTSSSPANNPEAFAVGATDMSDALSPWSSRGPSACDGSVYPDLVAPGVNVHTTDLFGFYADESGTSMAAPHVAGALALLLNAFPDLPADRQETALTSGAIDLGAAGPDNDFGSGRLDALASYQWLASAPDFTLDASPGPANPLPGGSVGYTVSVGPLNGFTGDVTLSLSGLTASQANWTFTPATVTGGSGTSQLSIVTAASLAPGTYPLTLTGTSGSTTHKVSISLVVDPPPDFSLGVSPSSASTLAGGSVGYTVMTSPVNGFTGDVTLSLSGLTASQANWTFTPGTVAGSSGSSQLSIATARSLTPGTYPLTVTGTSGSTTHSVSVSLVVQAPPDFLLSVTPSSATTLVGGTVGYSVAVGSLNGFAGDVALSLSGLTASQASWTFTSGTVTGSGTSQLSIATAGSLAPGNYPLIVSGASGSLVHTATATLVVNPSTLTAFPANVSILTGTYRAGSAASLSADDASFYELNSMAFFVRTTSWYGRFPSIPNGVNSLKVTYKGKNSRACTQTVSIWRWTTSTWVQLDSRSVGTTEILIADLAPSGALADYVSGTSGPGEVRVRISCQTTAGTFVASGNLLKLVYS